MARLRRNRFAAVALAWMSAFGLFACATPSDDSLTRSDDESSRSGTISFEPREVAFYQNTLRQLPLRLDSAYQDLSTVLSIREDNAHMVGMHYFYHGGLRDLYATFSNNHVFRMNAADFALDWTADLGYRPMEGPVAHGQSVTFHLEGPRVRSYWREGQPSGQQIRTERLLYQSPTSPLAANDDGFYFGVAQNFRVYGWLDSNRKGPQWHWQGRFSGTRVAQPIFADLNEIYFYSESGHIVSIDAQNGNQNWIYPYDGTSLRLLAPMQVKYDIFWFGDITGTLYAMDKSSRIFFQFPAGEPIVSTPFISDYYVLFQTPTRLICIRPAYVDEGQGRRFLRAAENGADVTKALWSLQLVTEETARDFAEARVSMRDILDSRERRKIRPLMKGRTWIYFLETTEDGRKFVFRVQAETGQLDSEINPETNQPQLRRFDVSAFPYILTNDDPDNRAIYFGTYEGYLFGMRE